MSRHIKEIEEDQRISDLLKILRERDVGDSYTDTAVRDHLTAESLDSVTKTKNFFFINFLFFFYFNQ